MIALPNDDAALMSAPNVRRMLDLNEMREWRWRKAGVLPEPVKILNRNFYRVHELRAALARLDVINPDRDVARRAAA